MKALVVEHHRYSSDLRVGSHHVAEMLVSRGDEVVWVSHPRSLAHRLLGSLPPQVVEHQPGLLEVTPRVVLPYMELPLLGTALWGRRWLTCGATTRRLLASQGADRFHLLWLSDFTMLPLLDLVEAEKVVLRFFDRLTHLGRFPRSAFGLVARYQHRADLILASSRVLQDDLSRLGIKATYLPNAGPAGESRPPMSADRSPRVVYIGALEGWFDLETVEIWAAALPEVLFDIGGPNPRNLSSSAPNVVFRGPIPPDDVPRFLGGARFGIIPFKRNDLTLGVHPIKLYDYLSAGCPVLSVDLPEVKPHPAGIFTYRTPEAGLEVLRRQLDARFDRHRLVAMADQNRWPARLAPIFNRLGLGAE